MSVRLGCVLPSTYPEAVEVAELAEELGYESVWLPDHLVLPVDVDRGQTPRDGMAHPRIRTDYPFHDTYVLLGQIAAATTRVRIGSWVLNVALRHPFVTASAFRSLDWVSEGRMELGVGTGWLAGEYEAAGVAFASRGRRVDEALDVIRLLWRERAASYEGEHFSFPPVHFEPKPVQQPLPIHVGGDADAALRRAARRGDGWIGSWHTPGSAAERVVALRAACEGVGRDPAELLVTVGCRRPDEGELEDFAAAGVHRVVVQPWSRSVAAAADLRAYTAELRPPA